MICQPGFRKRMSSPDLSVCGMALLRRKQAVKNSLILWSIHATGRVRTFADGSETRDPVQEKIVSSEGSSPEGQQQHEERPGEGAEPASKPARRRLRRLSRAERITWRNNPGVANELAQSAPVWPVDQPFYDVQGQAPFLLTPTNPVFEAYKRLKAEQPEAFEELCKREEEDEPPRQGAQKILEWEISAVFDSDPISGETHPLNKKVKCRVYLRDLQREFGLSDAALQHIALICGPRYNPNKGLMTLTSEKYAGREDNRHHIVEILHRLIDEGASRFPNQAAATA